jgi:hypothetical protein
VTIDPPPVEVEFDLNRCPDFYSFMLEPPRMGPRTPTFVAAYAEDPEDDTILYSFSATSGIFANVRENTATYRCDELGPQTISVLAIDVKGCARVLNIRVTCDAI